MTMQNLIEEYFRFILNKKGNGSVMKSHGTHLTRPEAKDLFDVVTLYANPFGYNASRVEGFVQSFFDNKLESGEKQLKKVGSGS
mmetsp:Transcript_46031/g.89926  ORF Transcript_46031/g.89926 Transcript_46031/m.89926 type:complete len:84 (+) Transcript_46031:31-282(+)